MNKQKLKRWILPVSLAAAGLILTVTLICLLVGCNGASKFEKAFVLSETEISMMTGETKTLSLENPEDKDVGDYTLAWMTDNPSVATVTDDGTVTAVAPGTAKITVVVRAKKTEVYFDSTVTVTENTTPLSSLSFNASVYSLGEGQTLDLNKEVIRYPATAVGPSLKWTSSNTAIATVTDGIIIPVSEGISTITVSTEDGSISAVCTVRISEISVDPTGISFEEEEYSVTEGKTLELIAKVAPENATGYSILWTSSDPTVATVSGGTVTAVNQGEAVITARLNIGGGKMSAQCKVFVDPAGEVSVPATKVQLNPASMTIPDGANGPFKFGLTIAPANCTDRPVWTTNRSDLLNINASTGEFTIIKAPTDSSVSVLVTCTVGDLSSTAVVNISPRKPKLIIGLSDSSPETLYDKAPFNEITLVAGFEGSDDLPDVTWESNNKSVATVDKDGTVTGHSAGNCTVTAVSKTDSSVKATYTVTVQKAPYESITVGETITIDASLIPKDDITWQCDPLYLEIDPVALTVKALKEAVDTPTQVFGVSASGGLYTIDVYILPAAQ